jgi:CHAD domain-containing protein
MAKRAEVDGLSSEMAFAEAGALVVETRAAELLRHSEGVLDTAAIEGVHDMRVATRRLRAALEVFSPCFPKGPRKRVLKEIKAVADALGERRDRDVAIAMLSGIAESVPSPDRPGIGSLIERYRAEQLEANERLVPYVAPERVERIGAAVRELAAQARAAVESSDRQSDLP